MAGEKVYVAKHEGQVVGTRTSKRTYTHAVIVRRSYDRAIENAYAAAASKHVASNWEYGTRYAGMTREQALAAIDANPEIRPDMRAFYYRDLDTELPKHTALKAEHPTVESYRAAKLASELAEIEADKAAGRFETFGALAWCGRRDLALKEQSRELSGGRWAEVLVAEAEVERVVGEKKSKAGATSPLATLADKAEGGAAADVDALIEALPAAVS